MSDLSTKPCCRPHELGSKSLVDKLIEIQEHYAETNKKSIRWVNNLKCLERVSGSNNILCETRVEEKDMNLIRNYIAVSYSCEPMEEYESTAKDPPDYTIMTENGSEVAGWMSRMTRSRSLNTLSPDSTSHNTPVAMTMAILTIVIGAMEAAGAFTEFWSGVQHPAGSGPFVLGSAMGVAAAGLLLGSGVALLRGSPGAVPMARGAAITCIVVFLLISYVLPMMGYFAQILGIGFPVILLLYLWLSLPCNYYLLCR